MNGTSRDLRFTRLTLAGFGLYERPARFLFPEGGGVLVGPNESGKSTLVHGLCAVLFGLNTDSDPSRAGDARFRSFSARKGEFWGELEWEAGGQRFRLWRSFESHRVRLTEDGSEGPTILFDQEHNPRGARSARNAFADVLRARIGVDSMELFQETFCLGQPLADGPSISADLQHLLSGSRAGRINDVLERLFAEIKDLTSKTSELGVRPGHTRAANQQNPGRIETLEEELERSRLSQDQGRNLLAQMNEHNAELERIQQQIRETELALRHRRERTQSLGAWLKADEERRRAVDAIASARSALSSLEEIEGARRLLEPDLTDRFAPFRNAPADLDALLDRLDRALQERERAVSDRTTTEDRRRDCERQVAEQEARLTQEFAGVRGRPDLPALRRRLDSALARQDARKEAAAVAKETIERQKRRIAELGPRGQGPAVATLRAAAEAFLSDVRRLEQIQARLDRIASESEDRAFLEGSRLQALRSKLEEEREARAQRSRLREAEARLADLERAQALAEAAQRTRRFPVAPALSVLSVAVAAGAGALIGYGLQLGTGSSLALALALAALALGLSLFLARRWTRTASRAEPGAAADRPIAKVAGNEASAAADRPIAGVAANEAEAAALDAATLPAAWTDGARLAAAIATWRQSLESLESDIRRLEGDLGPFTTTTEPELARLEERWARFDEEATGLRAERAVLTARRFPGRTSGETAGDPLAFDYRTAPVEALSPELLAARRLPGAPGDTTAGPLLDWLASLRPEDWQRLTERDAALNEAETVWSHAVREKERLEQEQAADDEAEELLEQLRPFTPETSADSLTAMVAVCAQEERELEARVSRFEALPSSADLEARLARSEAAVNTALEPIQATWPEGNLPAAVAEDPLAWIRQTRDLEREARRAWQKAGELDRAREHVLDTARASSREEIERRRIEAEALLGSLLRELKALEETDPLLAGAREEPDPLVRAQRLQEMDRKERSDSEQEAAALEAARVREREILRKLAALEGSEAPNLARLEIRIREIEAELAELNRERDAVTLAYHWVGEAAAEFQRAYRQDLEDRITDRFRFLTGSDNRRVAVGESFEHTVIAPGGEPLVPEQLSQGTRDQLALAVRLAVADLLSGSRTLPFLFDDPFVHYDAERLQHLKATLKRLAEERQWLLLTHRTDLSGWGAPVVREM